MSTGKKGKSKKVRNTATANTAKSRRRGRSSAAEHGNDATARAGRVASVGAKGKTKKTATRGEENKRPSALNAAADVLKKSGKPMSCQELISAMAEQGLWTSPKGKTPHATLYSAILREIGNKDAESRFRKVARGQFEFAGKGA